MTSPVTETVIEAACRARHSPQKWGRTLNNPEMAGWINSQRAEMQMILTAAFETAGHAPTQRITGATDIVDEAACLIWAELCPGMVMGDDDRQHYENAAKAVLALTSTVGKPDYSPLTPEEIAQTDPELTELYENSTPVSRPDRPEAAQLPTPQESVTESDNG